MRNRNKIKSKKAGADLITIIMAIVIFAAVSTFVVSTLLGDKSKRIGIAGASQNVNEEILKSMP